MVYSDVIRTDFVRSWNSLEHFEIKDDAGCIVTLFEQCF